MLLFSTGVVLLVRSVCACPLFMQTVEQRCIWLVWLKYLSHPMCMCIRCCCQAAYWGFQPWKLRFWDCQPCISHLKTCKSQLKMIKKPYKHAMSGGSANTHCGLARLLLRFKDTEFMGCQRVRSSKRACASQVECCFEWSENIKHSFRSSRWYYWLSRMVELIFSQITLVVPQDTPHITEIGLTFNAVEILTDLWTHLCRRALTEIIRSHSKDGQSPKEEIVAYINDCGFSAADLATLSKVWIILTTASRGLLQVVGHRENVICHLLWILWVLNVNAEECQTKMTLHRCALRRLSLCMRIIPPQRLHAAVWVLPLSLTLETSHETWALSWKKG